MKSALLASTTATIVLSFIGTGVGLAQNEATPQQQDSSDSQQQNGPSELMLRLPEGFSIEKVMDGLNFPTTLAWDDQDQMYVVEAGGALYPEQKEPIRILRVEPGKATEVANLTEKGIMTAAVGLAWHDGAFYVTHRDGDDLTGAVSRVMTDGSVEQVFNGIIDSQAEHQINDIAVGPDGRMYVTVGPAGNSGVVDPSIAPWVMKSPELHPTPCQDIVLTGRNFRTPNFMTKDDKEDTTLTGAYVPFGTETEPGQVIEGVNKCGGSILAFDPANAEETIQPYAWGFRNLLGLAWNEETGQMYVAQNGYDIRGARPVQDEGDPVYRVEEGAWYGVPDFSAALEPLTEPRFEPPDEHQAMVVVGGEEVGKELAFLIDHEASGLTPPDTSLLLSLHPFNSSPSMIDVAPSSWGDMAGHVLVAEWGDLAPPTNPLRGKEPAGYRVVSVDPETGEIEPFIWNTQPGPASANDAQGRGFDRPFEVDFGPDGALYVVDYGVVEIDMSLTEKGEPPYREVPGTGVIWKVTRTGTP
jgi:glucose/arabinose dehydrogenase